MKFRTCERSTASDDSNLLPLVNVVFLLLIFILLAGTLGPSDALKIEPAFSHNADPARQGKLKIGLALNGTITVGGKFVSKSELEQLLNDSAIGSATSDKHQIQVQVLADRRAISGDLQALLRLLSQLGYQDVQLVTQRVRQ